MKWAAVIWAIPVLFIVQLTGCDLMGGADSSQSMRYGPRGALDPLATPHPDRIILTWSGDPATSQSVTWRTDTSVAEAFAEIAPATAGPKFYAEATRLRAETSKLRTNFGDAHYHAAEFTGLEPDSTYVYRVGSTEGWSEWFQFRTAGTRGDPFCFIYFGDVQCNVFAMWSRMIRMAYQHAPNARFMIHAGDLVDCGDDDEQWEAWFCAGSWIYAMIPSIPAAGNHEYYSTQRTARALPDHWRAQFTLPENGVPGLEETNYYLDYHDMRVVVLDSNAELEAQAAWLRNVLSSNPRRWTVAVLHHPIFPATVSRDFTKPRELLKPLLDEYGVDLVLQGHDHTYARGTNQPGRNPDARVLRGPVYVVSVSGPKMYELPEERWMDREAENIQLFQVISVEHDALRYTAYTALGEVFDEFAVVK